MSVHLPNVGDALTLHASLGPIRTGDLIVLLVSYGVPAPLGSGNAGLLYDQYLTVDGKRGMLTPKPLKLGQ